MFSLYTFCQTAYRHLYSHSQRYKISVDIVIISPGYSSCQTTNKYVYMIYYTRQVWILYLPSLQLCQTAHTHIHLYILYERSVHTVFALCTVLSNSLHTFVQYWRYKRGLDTVLFCPQFSFCQNRAGKKRRVEHLTFILYYLFIFKSQSTYFRH